MNRNFMLVLTRVNILFTVRLFRMRTVLRGNIAAVGALGLAAATSAAELIRGGGFEAEGLSSWYFNTGVQLTNSPSHGGTGAVAMAVGWGEAASVAQEVGSQMIAGESYTFSAWIYLSGPSSKLPTLLIEPTGNNSMLLTWPASASAFVLQESPDLLYGNWTITTATPVIDGDVKQVTVPVFPGKRFYRLARP